RWRSGTASVSRRSPPTSPASSASYRCSDVENPAVSGLEPCHAGVGHDVALAVKPKPGACEPPVWRHRQGHVEASASTRITVQGEGGADNGALAVQVDERR